MSSITDLRKDAVSLGLKDDEIFDYVTKQQAYSRADRASEREAELQKLTSQNDLAKEKLAIEERQKIRDHELEMLKLRQANPIAETAVDISEYATRPKLPIFRDGDDIKAFIIRFERIAALLNLNRASWALRLGSVLSGKAVDIFASLPPDVTNDYDLQNNSLLRGYNKTPESYRRDFRAARISPNETYAQFSTKLARNLDYWVESLKVENTYDALRNFMLSDQFLASVSSDLRQFLKENDAKTLTDMVTMADNWSTARGAYPKDPKVPGGFPVFSSLPNNTSDRHMGLVRGPDSSVPHRSPAIYKDSRKDVKCFSCGLSGHVKSRCPQSPSTSFHDPRKNAHNVNFCLDDDSHSNFMRCGTVNGSPVSTVLRDTGCSCVIVSETVIPDADISQCKRITLSDYLGRESSFPVVRCYINCPFLNDWVDAVLAPIKFCSVLVGNVKGVINPFTPAHNSVTSVPEVCSVATRASSKLKPVHPLVVPNLSPISLTADEFKDLQSSCVSLSDVRRKAEAREVLTLRDGSSYEFVVDNGYLYRKCLSSSFRPNVGKMSLVVPSSCRQTILEVSHESPVAGHFSHRKTESKIRDNFFWPTLGTDVRSFCRSCDKCQRYSSKGRVKRVPLVKVPVITEPFSRVSIDLVGPLSPSEEGHRFILTLIDHATGFPEAVPLRETNTIAVSEALLTIFSRVGIPRELLSDRGPQFSSQLMGELHRLLGVKPLFSSPYHPMGNARVERLHSTLVTCLRKLCADKPKQWHRFIVPTLFALREVPSDRTGFSAFELLYGRQVRGPLTVLRDLWTDKTLPVEERSCYQYVLELRDKLEDCAEIAARNADISITNYKTYFDLKSQDRQFSPGDEVLILLPDDTKKLLVSWKGPFKVLERKNRVNYVLDLNGKAKLYHVNLLKKYHRRAVVGFSYVNDNAGTLNNPSQSDPLFVCQSCIVEDFDNGDNNPNVPSDLLNLPDVDSSRDSPKFGDLNTSELSDVTLLISKFPDVFSDVPGCTDTVVHDIQLSTSEPFRAKVYPVPMHLTSHFNHEVDKLLSLGIIQPSSSAFRNPVVMVHKPDKSYRLTLDTRAVNAVTVFHAEPSCSLEEELHKFSKAKFFTEMDLTKAYHQIKLTPYARQFTAFATHRGLMEYCRLPFGLVTACATYIRLMRIVLNDLSNVSFYFDNVLVFSTSWEEHLVALRSVLDRFRSHNLTVNLSKCKFGFRSLEYLGFVLGHGTLEPQQSKTRAILAVPLPNNKKTLRSFLGMISFYRKFIPNAASLSGPLSDLLRKNSREPLVWTDFARSNFTKLKECLSIRPILKLPDPCNTFVLRTDASGTGIGAVLMQYTDDTPFPVAYASRKLLDREKNFSTIERECLAIVFGVSKFQYYLLGREFILEVDHKPLIYMHKLKGSNSRLMRWALALQPYRFRIVHIRGCDNLGSDFLSR